MPKALAEALRAEISKRDNVHESLQIIDQIVHQLIEVTSKMHAEEEDCDCVKHGQPGHKHA